METLKEKLDRIRERIEGGMSAQFLKIMHLATARLEASGTGERTLGLGNAAPEFQLEDQNGEIRDSRQILTQGPMVLTYYRGFW